MLRSSHDACGCSTQTTSTINLKRSTLHPHEGQADRPNTPSDSVNPGSNPGPPANKIKWVPFSVATAPVAATAEAPQWHHRQRGKIPDRANRPLPRHGDSDTHFAAEVHSFLR